jgi:glutamate--glyoxylate aminotransferase
MQCRYPLYTASIALLGGTGIPYYLDESNGWSLEVHAILFCPSSDVLSSAILLSFSLSLFQYSYVLQIAELERAIKNARSLGITPRGLVIINPGNPTGQCLDVSNMREVRCP